MSLSQRVEICAEHYANSMRAVLEDSHELQIDLHRLPFELLLAEPRRSLRRVCQSVGLDFRPDMLPAAGQRLPLGTRFGDRWYPLRSDVNRPYAARLDAETIETVNRHCGDLVQRLGYQRRQPSQALLARAA